MHTYNKEVIQQKFVNIMGRYVGLISEKKEKSNKKNEKKMTKYY